MVPLFVVVFYLCKCTVKEGACSQVAFQAGVTASVCLSSRCQLQVFLRLELCRQCPSVPDSVGAVERAVEEASALPGSAGHVP